MKNFSLARVCDLSVIVVHILSTSVDNNTGIKCNTYSLQGVVHIVHILKCPQLLFSWVNTWTNPLQGKNKKHYVDNVDMWTKLWTPPTPCKG